MTENPQPQETPQIDMQALREVLARAKVSIDSTLQSLQEGKISVSALSRVPALSETNSSCNTGCSCGGGSLTAPV